MSAINFSAAVASLQPGLSTSSEIALNSWTVIKGVSDTLSPVLKTSHILAACATGLIAVSLFTTLVRGHLPTIPTQQRKPDPTQRFLLADTLRASAFAFGISGLTIVSTSIALIFHYSSQSLSPQLSEAVDFLRPGTATPYDVALVKWDFIKDCAENLPNHLAQLQHVHLVMGVCTAIVVIAAYRQVRSPRLAQQPEEYSVAKQRLRYTTISCLELATVVSLSAYVCARISYPKLA